MKFLAVMALMASTFAAPAVALADDPPVTGSRNANTPENVDVGAVERVEGLQRDGSERSQESESDAPARTSPSGPTWEYEWRTRCGNGSVELGCAAARVCPEPGQTQWLLYGRPSGSGTWQMLGTSCGDVPPPVPAGPGDLPADVRPQVTPDLVLREVRTLGLPTVRAQVQPAGETLINFDTIFYAQRPSFERTVGLLGYTVDVTAEPTSYQWHHGDGTSRSTTSPGAPYPSKEIVHRYERRATLEARVDVTYRVRFRVDGGDWETIDELITATGPGTEVVVREAAPLLTS